MMTVVDEMRFDTFPQTEYYEVLSCFQTLVFSQLNNLTQLIARDKLNIFRINDYL